MPSCFKDDGSTSVKKLEYIIVFLTWITHIVVSLTDELSQMLNLRNEAGTRYTSTHVSHNIQTACETSSPQDSSWRRDFWRGLLAPGYVDYQWEFSVWGLHWFSLECMKRLRPEVTEGSVITSGFLFLEAFLKISFYVTTCIGLPMKANVLLSWGCAWSVIMFNIYRNVKTQGFSEEHCILTLVIFMAFRSITLTSMVACV